MHEVFHIRRLYRCKMRRLFLLSSTQTHGHPPLSFCLEELKKFLGSEVHTILFIPYALFDYDKYTEKIRSLLHGHYDVVGIHAAGMPEIEAVNKAEAIYIGGGNTFKLLKTLYETNLIEPIRNRVLHECVPYIGSSAGTNVATKNICTTNDMPICMPPSFDALRLVNFNINPHYIEPDPCSTHCGETRDDRICEYMQMNSKAIVLGLPEGTWLEVAADKIKLRGIDGKTARLFRPNEKTPIDCSVGSDLSELAVE